MQVVSGADPGKKQQLRRIDGAAAKNYLPARPGLMRLAVLNVRDAGSALALPQQPGCMGVGLDPEVGALERRLQISVGSAVAPPALLRHLVKPTPSCCGPLKSSFRGKPSSSPAAINAQERGLLNRKSATWRGPPAAWYSEAPRSWSSAFLKYGRISAKLQPALPRLRQWS